MNVLKLGAPLDRSAVRDFYDRYYATLDDLALDRWPELFTEECLYEIVPRENRERGLPLATLRAESRGMLRDRVTGILKTQMFAPRYYRRFPGPLTIVINGDEVRVRHNLLIIQTLRDQQPEIILCGGCADVLVVQGERLLLRERAVTFDSEMILNSLIYPV